MSKSNSTFVYVTYIRTTPEQLWEALTNKEFSKQFWFGVNQETDWKPGSPWRLIYDDGRVMDSGEILDLTPLKQIKIKWRNEWSPEFNAEGYSLCVMDIEQTEGSVKLTITHSMEREGSGMIKAVSGGWPKILSNLKSLLETGSVLTPDKKTLEKTS